MSQAYLWIRRSSIVSVASVIEFGLRFARTAILSRLLVPAEFGTAVAITVVIGMAGLVTDIAYDKFVIVSTDERRALGAAHVLSVSRGVLLALVLAASARFSATLFGVPQFASSFALAALFPLVISFANLGTKQMQGRHDYAPESIAQLLSNTAGIISLILAVYFFGDHRAILAGFLGEAVVYTAASHVLARAKYELRSTQDMLRAALSFGIPLMLNGVGLAVISQVDRVVVAHWFGVETLAIYAVILSMSVVPISVINRVFGSMSFSYLTLAKKNSLSIEDRFEPLVFVFTLIGVLYGLFIAIGFDLLTPLIFGHAFQINPVVHVLMTLVVTCRVTTGASVVSLLAAGRTWELAIITLLAGSVGLISALALIHWWPHFELLLVGLLIGDVCFWGLFFLFSSLNTPIAQRSGKVFVDLTIALFAITIIAGTLSLRPEAAWQARMIVCFAGLSTVAMQVIFGLPRHRVLKSFFLDAWRRRS